MIGHGQRLFLEIKADAFIRKILCHSFSAKIPLYIVNEYPKSGGTWFAQMLSDYLCVPFPRNRLPILMPLVPQVLHGHYRYSPRLKNVFCVIRDGRDVMVSYYYHSLFVHENGLNKIEVEITQRHLNIRDPENIHKNLPKFIEYKFTKRTNPRFTWREFISDWCDKDVPIIRYEDLLIRPAKELGNAIDLVTGIYPEWERLEKIAEKYKFGNIAGRKPGEEKSNSFLRKGISGDWKTKFNQQAKEVFHYYAGDMLIHLGYEKDDTWVNCQ
jgi:hypothetical protein